MKRYIASFLCLSSLMLGQAHAQEDYQASCCEMSYGFYLGGYGGGSWWQSGYFTSAAAAGQLRQYEPDKGYHLGAFAGYRCCNGIRLEAEIARREHDIDRVYWYNGSMEVKEDLTNTTYSAWSLMGNVLLETTFPTCDCCFRPYFGFGFGVASLQLRANHNNLLASDNDNSWAYQLIIGIAWPFSDCTDIGLEYRWFAAEEFTLDATVSSTASTLVSREWQGQHSFLASIKTVIGSPW